MPSQRAIAFGALVLSALVGGLSALGRLESTGSATHAFIDWSFALAAVLSIAALLCLAFDAFRPAWITAAAAAALSIPNVFMGGFYFSFLIVAGAGAAAVIVRGFDLGERMRDIAADAHELDPP